MAYFCRLLVAIGMFTLGNAQGAIVVTTMTNLDGTFTYSYEVDNTAGTFDVFSWSLELAVPADDIDWKPLDKGQGGDVVVPSGDMLSSSDDWGADRGIAVVELWAQDFFAVDAAGGGDVVIGSSLDGFEVTSALPPGPATYVEYGPAGQSLVGSTIGPSMIPEPGVGVLVLVGLASLIGTRRRSVLGVLVAMLVLVHQAAWAAPAVQSCALSPLSPGMPYTLTVEAEEAVTGTVVVDYRPHARAQVREALVFEGATGSLEGTLAGDLALAAGDVVRFRVILQDVNGEQTRKVIAGTVVDEVAVPSVVGLTEPEARALLASSGLTTGTVATAASDSVPAGAVISQAIKAGAVVSPGTGMGFVVSAGREMTLILLNTPKVAVGEAALLEVRLSSPAPVGGVEIDLAALLDGVVGLADPPVVQFLEGEVARTVAVAGITVGTSAVEASAVGYASASVLVEVTEDRLSVPATLEVAFGSTVSLPISILPEPAPAGGVEVEVLSMNEAVVGVTSAMVTIPEGQTAVNVSVEGVGIGTTTVLVRHPDYASDTVEVTSSAEINIVENFVAFSAGFPAEITLRLENNGSPVAAPSGGVVVDLEVGDLACAVVPESATIPEGLSQVTVPVRAGSGGAFPCNTTVTATLPGGLHSDAVNVSVNPSPVIEENSSNTPPPVGVGLHDPRFLRLSESNHGGVAWTATVSDPSVALLAPDASTVGMATATGSLDDGFDVFPVWIQGLTEGSVEVTVSAPGFVSIVLNVEVVAPVVGFLFLGEMAEFDLFGGNRNVSVQLGVPFGNGGVSPQRVQPVGDPIVANFGSSDPSVGTWLMDGEPTTEAQLTFSHEDFSTDKVTVFQPLNAGTTTLTITGDALGESPRSTVVMTVVGSSLTIGNPFNDLGNGLQELIQVALSAPTLEETIFTVTSDDPDVFVISPDATTVGAAAVEIPVLASRSNFSFYMQGRGEGSASVSVSGVGYTGNSIDRTVVKPSIRLDTRDGVFGNLRSSVDFLEPNLRVIARLAPSASRFVASQAVAPGTGGIEVTVSNSESAVAELVRAGASGQELTVTIPEGELESPSALEDGGLQLRPLGAGMTVLTGSGIGLNASEDLSVEVTAPRLGFDRFFGNNLAPTRVGAGLQQAVTVFLSSGNHGGRTVTLTSQSPENVLVSPDASTAGAATIAVDVADGVTQFEAYINGVSMLDEIVLVTATTEGFETGNLEVEVEQAYINVLLVGRTQSLDPPRGLHIDVGIARNPEAQLHTGNWTRQAIRAGTGPVTFALSNGEPTIGELQISVGAGQSVDVVLDEGESSGFGRVEFDPISPGTTVIRASAPGFLQAPSGGLVISVETPTITIAGGFGSIQVPSGSFVAVTPQLSVSTHGGVEVMLTSSNPSVALVSVGGGSPSESATVTLEDGTFSTPSNEIGFRVHGVEGASGQVVLTASVPGFLDGTRAVDVIETAALEAAERFPLTLEPIGNLREQFGLRWHSDSTQSYLIEASEHLDSWMLLGRVEGTGDDIVYPLSRTEMPIRFFRLRALDRVDHQ